MLPLAFADYGLGLWAAYKARGKALFSPSKTLPLPTHVVTQPSSLSVAYYRRPDSRHQCRRLTALPSTYPRAILVSCFRRPQTVLFSTWRYARLPDALSLSSRRLDQPPPFALRYLRIPCRWPALEKA
ncbi:hypothetical protein ACJZ2D_002680 [Fusarium nematophilum]